MLKTLPHKEAYISMSSNSYANLSHFYANVYGALRCIRDKLNFSLLSVDCIY